MSSRTDRSENITYAYTGCVWSGNICITTYIISFLCVISSGLVMATLRVGQTGSAIIPTQTCLMPERNSRQQVYLGWATWWKELAVSKDTHSVQWLAEIKRWKVERHPSIRQLIIHPHTVSPVRHLFPSTASTSTLWQQINTLYDVVNYPQ